MCNDTQKVIFVYKAKVLSLLLGVCLHHPLSCYMGIVVPVSTPITEMELASGVYLLIVHA